MSRSRQKCLQTVASSERVDCREGVAVGGAVLRKLTAGSQAGLHAQVENQVSVCGREGLVNAGQTVVCFDQFFRDTLPYMGGGFQTGPMSGVIMDAAGNLYGTTFGGGAYSQGSVFKLTPTNNGWVFTSLHDFQSPPEGAFPYGNLLMDASGNLFGTATQGGDYGDGTVWEITP
jgi:uncharacterized repeat protein (TIGR03803 family)